jgi:hypothetical protein
MNEILIVDACAYFDLHGKPSVTGGSVTPATIDSEEARLEAFSFS